MLFDTEQPDHEEKPSAGAGQRFDGDIEMPASMKLLEVIDLVATGRCVLWLTDGDWSMHDMLMAILDRTGPANVYLSSYAFSEFPARLIADMKSRGIIRELHCLIDKRLDVRSASALNIIRNTATRLRLVRTHAKVTVIENDQHLIAVVGSANYTSNKRYEAGVILADRDAALFHKKWITDAFDRK
ncbi:MAG: hypothetical protein IAE96_04895 [Chitinophagaceae bacterium]|nr:hypothetical protein [Chitinophagaceae bacterium]